MFCQHNTNIDLPLPINYVVYNRRVLTYSLHFGFISGGKLKMKTTKNQETPIDINNLANQLGLAREQATDAGLMAELEMLEKLAKELNDRSAAPTQAYLHTIFR